MEHSNDIIYYEPYGYTIPIHTGNQCVLTYGILTNNYIITKVNYKYILNK